MEPSQNINVPNNIPETPPKENLDGNLGSNDQVKSGLTSSEIHVSDFNPGTTVPNQNIKPSSKKTKIKKFLPIVILAVSIICFILILLIAGSKNSLIGGNSYTDPTTGFQISAPTGWKRDETNVKGPPDLSGVSVYNETDWGISNGGDGGCGEDCPFANITIQTYKASDDSLDDAENYITGLGPSNWQNYTVQSATKTTINGVPAYYILDSFGCGGYPPNSCNDTAIVENYQGVIYYVYGSLNDNYGTQYDKAIKEALKTFRPGQSPDISAFNNDPDQSDNSSTTSSTTSSNTSSTTTNVTNVAPGNTSDPTIAASQCYKLEALSGAEMGAGSGDPVTAINPTSRTITLSYMAGSSTLNSTYTIPADATIVGGTNCTSIPFNTIKVKDKVTLYRTGNSSTFTYVYDHN